MVHLLRRVLGSACLLGLTAAWAQSDPTAASLAFAFGSAGAVPGYTVVRPDMLYSTERGFGFEAGATVTAVDRGGTSLRDHFVTGAAPFYFTARVPREGNYRVTVTLGDAQGESTTTIKAELRRLMVEKIHTAKGQFETVSFIVNTRTPQIAARGEIAAGVVKLKAPRESVQEGWAWDDAITLEFANQRPAVCAVLIEPVEVPTVFLIGDSTVCDQSREPFNSWGQMLPRFFRPDIAVANHAESGETYRDSIGRRRLDKMLSVMKPGDWMLMQFGHNDQKQIAAGTGGPFTTYKAEIKRHLDAVRQHGGTPVVVSPMERRNFTPDGKLKPSLADYAAAAREAAAEEKVAFIDLNAMSIRFYEALGPERAYLAFAGTGLTRDATHHDNYGSYELAKCILQGIREARLPLAEHIVADLSPFDPGKPDPVESFAVPPSGNFTSQRPLGN